MSLSTLSKPRLVAFALIAAGCSSTSTASDSSQASASASASVGSGAAVAVGQTFAMSPGQSVALPNRGSLRYVGVKQDSRCPPERQCVWAGDAEVTFEWSAAGASAQSFGLHTGFKDKSSKALSGHTLILVSLDRGTDPQAQLKLEASP